MPLSGTQLKKEPLVGKGSKFVVRTGTCNFLYILDLTGFTVDMNDLKMYKNSAFYTYANPQKK